jgi:hypothetical protein
VQRLDKPDVLTMPEDQRFVYMMNVAGKMPLAQMSYDPDNMNGCPPHTQEDENAIEANDDKARNAFEARFHAMKDWSTDLQGKYGAQFDDKMRDAARALRSSGRSAEWPTKIEFGNEPVTSSFRDTEHGG